MAERKSVFRESRRQTISTALKPGTISSHGVRLNVDPRALTILEGEKYSGELSSPTPAKTAIAINIAGIEVSIRKRICLNKGIPHELAASTVVSLRGDTLSPKYAPDIIAPAIQAGESPIASPIPERATPTVAIVVHEEPVTTETAEQMMHAEARKKVGDRSWVPMEIKSGITPEIIHVVARAPIHRRRGIAGSIWTADRLNPIIRVRAGLRVNTNVRIAVRSAIPESTIGEAS